MAWFPFSPDVNARRHFASDRLGSTEVVARQAFHLVDLKVCGVMGVRAAVYRRASGLTRVLEILDESTPFTLSGTACSWILELCLASGTRDEISLTDKAVNPHW